MDTTNRPVRFRKCLGRLAEPRLLRNATLGLLLIHVLIVLREFPPQPALSGQPPCSGDLSFHFASCFEGSELLRGWKLWGYSPYFMAGYPFGTWNSFGGYRGYSYAPLLLPMFSVGTAFYIYLVGTALLTPLLIAVAGVVMGLTRRESALCLCAAIGVYHADNMVSYFWTFGNVSFPFANALAVLYVACLIAAIERRSWRYSLAAGLLLGVIGSLHQLAVVPVFVASGVVLWLYRRDLARHGGIVYPLASALLGLVILLPWAAVLWRFHAQRMVCRYQALPSGWKYLVMDLFSDRAYRQAFDRRALLHLGMVLALGSALWLDRSVRRRLAAYLGSAIALFACTYAFQYSSLLRQTEPYRYLVAAAIFGIIPAAAGAKVAALRLAKTNAAGRRLAIGVSLMLLPSLTAYAFDVWRRSPACGLNDCQRQVVRWLRSNAPREGRVACQDKELAYMLPYHTGREVLGGSVQTAGALAHGLAAIGYSEAFGQPIRHVSPEYLRSYLDLYNASVVVAISPVLAGKVAGIPGWKEEFRAGRHVVFGRDPAALSWLYDAPTNRVTVVAAPNRISLRGAPAGRFVLKYHHLDTLTVTPGVELYPVKLLDDPVPFIGVDNAKALATVEIRNRCCWRLHDGSSR